VTGLLIMSSACYVGGNTLAAFYRRSTGRWVHAALLATLAAVFVVLAVAS
jgi:CBS-domain-containing membrane protein